MSLFDINGISVAFPYNPYDVQKDYMHQVIECLKTGTNGVLESPTGTGKTLSLLCASLAWIQHRKEERLAYLRTNVGCKRKDDGMHGANWANHDIPKLIYASRTHSQLSQAMMELKNSAYESMSAVILGSRDQLCIHPEVMREAGNSTKTNMCRAKLKTKSCSYHNRVEKVKLMPHFQQSTVMDIEDLVKLGTTAKACPFFLAKEKVEKSDILFMPYNYLLDPKSKMANNFELQNTIIILDEAHNIGKLCEETASVAIKSSDIALCIEDITKVMDAINSEPTDLDTDVDVTGRDFSHNDLVLLKTIVLDLEKVVDEIENCSTGKTYPGVYIYELLLRANITENNSNMIKTLLDQIITYLTTTSIRNLTGSGQGLQVLADVLSVTFTNVTQDYKLMMEQCYKVHIQPEQVNGPKACAISNAKVVNFWCFSSGFTMRRLVESRVHSIILTSGTLAPLNPFIKELGIPVNARLENPHIIAGSQVYVRVVSNGSDMVELNSSYSNRNNSAYIQSVGRTIRSFCPVIPGGLLVFFPSYSVMSKCLSVWQNCGIWAEISREKTIFLEPQKKDAFLKAMNEYYEKVNNDKGAIFMSVCRGKISEGLDFADINGRAVIIIGLPYPPYLDPRVSLKKQYVEEVRQTDSSSMSGAEWYSLEAIRAVNQAVGRVVRHKNDYGAILLCDTRFNSKQQQQRLSSWVLKNLQPNTPSKFGSIVGELAAFYRKASALFPLTKPSQDSVCSQKSSLDRNVATNFFKDFSAVSNTNESSSKGIILRSNNLKPCSSSCGKITELSNVRTDTINFSFPEHLKPSSIEDSSIGYSSEMHPVEKGMKVKRRRIVINDSAIQAGNESSMVSQLPREVKTETKPTPTAIGDPNEQNAHSSAVNCQHLKTSQNRVDLLKEIKYSLNPQKYKLFLVTLSNYKKHRNITALIEGFAKCFDHPNLYHFLNALKKNLSSEHIAIFESNFAHVFR